MMIDKPLIFHWRQPGERNARRLSLALLGFAAVGIVAVFWLLLPPGLLASVDWTKAWQKLLARPVEFGQLILAPLGVMAVLGGQAAHKKRARLILETDTLQYSSGLPVLGPLIDWTLDLKAVRANKLPLQLTGVAMGPQPANNYRLSWGMGQVKQLTPAAWHLPDQAPVALEKPTSSFGLVRWQTPENQALLQQQFNQLPLLQALRQRGIALPPLNGKRQMVGLDLMAYPRMKVAVITFFVALLSALVLFHLMRHHHYFTPPPLLAWVTFGTAAGLGMLTWLWPEHPGEANTVNAAQAIEFRSTQVLLAALTAVAAGLCAPSLPLAFSSTTQVSQDTAFELKHAPLRLQATTASGVPDVHPKQALDYWISQREGTLFSLPVRQGMAGLWWQFDSRALQDRLDAFYESKTRR
jgi:hypothetical protein